MIENEEIPEAKAIPIPPNPAPVALYGNQDAMDDFPVLKAFQQYVDSEQAKAHKRLMSVCFFFTMLIVVIIGVFIFVVMNMRNNHNIQDGTSEMQRQLMEQTAKMNDRLIQQLIANNNTHVPSPASVVVVGENNKEKPSSVDIALSSKERELAAREAELKKRELEEADRELQARENALKEREAKLVAETAAKAKKIAEEEAKAKREREILEHRRKLYPEYFDNNGKECSQPVTKRQTAAPITDKSTEESRNAEIARLRQEAEIAKLKAELAHIKQAQKTKLEPSADSEEDPDISELDEILQSSGIYGKGVKSKRKSDDTPSDILKVSVGDDDWTIPY